MSEIRDAIYGFIEPTKEDLQIINTPLFQRLRRIRQLACAYLVYPCALHTRFEHSLGVYHLSSIMAKKLLDKDPDKERIVRLSALLHDVGHGPFSHVSEHILEMFTDTTGSEKIHENITSKLIETNPEIEKIIGKNKIDQITGLLSGSKMDYSLMKQIVSGPLDADKQDYLLRDSYFCGVKYGVYDYLRLINTFEQYAEGKDRFIGVNEGGIHALEQFILAKYYMTWQVYRHRIRLITDQMIIRSLELGITKDDNEHLKKLYIYKDTNDYLNSYLNWWDDKLINFLVFETKTGYAHNIMKQVYERNLYKQAFSIKIKDYPEISGPSRAILQTIIKKENKPIRSKLESEIARILKTETECTIVNSYMVKSVKELARNDDPEGKIIILKQDGSKKDFEDESTVFQSIDESLNEVYIEVYAPVTFLDNRDRQNKTSAWKGEILEVLKNLNEGERKDEAK